MKNELFFQSASLTGSSWVYTSLSNNSNQGYVPSTSPDVALTPFLGSLEKLLDVKRNIAPSVLFIIGAYIQRIISFQRGRRGKPFHALKSCPRWRRLYVGAFRGYKDPLLLGRGRAPRAPVHTSLADFPFSQPAR